MVIPDPKAALAAISPELANLAAALLGGGLLVGAAAVIRALTSRKAGRVDDWDQTLDVTEKLLARRTREAEQARDRADRVWTELRRVQDELDQARRDLRTYQRRYGDLSDPFLPRVEGDEPPP